MIPKIVHVSWRDKNVIDNDLPMIVNGIKNIQLLNPDWKLIVYNDADIHQYLKENLSFSDYQLLQKGQFISQIDLWRLIKIYQEGGLYIDIDRFYNIPLKEILNPETRYLLPTNGDYDFSQDLMCSAPRNPVFRRAIELNLTRRHQGYHNTFYLGPQTYMHAVTEVLLGQQIDTDPGTETFNLIRIELAKYPFIKTYRETLPADTIVYRGDLSLQDLEQYKKQLYQHYQVVHWTEE